MQAVYLFAPVWMGTMMRIRLNVKGELVADFEIPPFSPMPGVVIWGDRTFALDDPDLPVPIGGIE
jgi:hypothetical protein